MSPVLWRLVRGRCRGTQHRLPPFSQATECVYEACPAGTFGDGGVCTPCHVTSDRERECVCGLFKRETEHLCLKPPIHGIGRDPFLDNNGLHTMFSVMDPRSILSCCARLKLASFCATTAALPRVNGCSIRRRWVKKNVTEPFVRVVSYVVFTIGLLLALVCAS